MRRISHAEYVDMAQVKKDELTADVIQKMNHLIEINDLYVCDSDKGWEAIEWQDQDGWTHIIPVPVTRKDHFENFRNVKKELSELYNSLYSFGMGAGISVLANAMEEKWGLDVYQVAGTLMAGSVSINWAKCYIGPLMALCASAVSK